MGDLISFYLVQSVFFLPSAGTEIRLMNPTLEYHVRKSSEVYVRIYATRLLPLMIKILTAFFLYQRLYYIFKR